MVPGIVQVIGVAYTYRVSQKARDSFSQANAAHSSHGGAKAFSYFKKIERPEHIVKDGEPLLLRAHPETGENVDHWYEPELALLLGMKHRIEAWALANDLTATGLEFDTPRPGYDPTYYGKCWAGSCAIGPRFFTHGEIRDVDDMDVGLRINRNGKTIYDHAYSTTRRIQEFSELPEMILDKRKGFGFHPPASKAILVEPTGFLPNGTVILAGTGLITPKSCYAKPGDLVTVYGPGLTLTNPVININVITQSLR